MAQRALVPRRMVERKPAHGSPCNNCGLCCWSSKCDIGRALFGMSDGPCPALRFDAEQNSYCDVVQNPGLYSAADPDEARAAAKLLLYSGLGCTMRINGELNLSFVADLEAFDAGHQNELDAACDLFGIARPD